jgi:hypothetical protein
MANDTSKAGKPASDSDTDKAQEKAAKKAERLKAQWQEQASEEKLAWQELHAKANKAIELYRAKPRFKWNDTIEKEILNRISNGQSIASICSLDHMPAPATVYEHMKESPSFAEGYSRARENMGAVLLDSALCIADDDSRDLLFDEDGNPIVNNAAIARAKLRIETRMRMAGKYNLRLADKPPTLDGANITVNNNTLQLDARALDTSQRDSLRQLLIAARDKAGQE